MPNVRLSARQKEIIGKQKALPAESRERRHTEIVRPEVSSQGRHPRGDDGWRS